MSIITIILIAMLIPAVQLAQPSIQLTFTPNEKYMARNHQVEIQCELLNPNQRTDSVQLWYIDLKTGARTSVSRTLLTAPTEDSPEIFKVNRNKRYKYVRKNHILIQNLQMEDSADYECNCPDCEDSVEKKTRRLLVMHLKEPVWKFESGWPLHENTKVLIKCQVDDFYPHVGHRILRDNQEITKDGHSSLSPDKSFPQKLLWEATVTPKADWHNSTLLCSVTEGNINKEVTKTLDVLFAARFLACDEQQFVDAKAEKSKITCTYSGNPAPQITWFRQSDQKPITIDNGIHLATEHKNHGEYKSIVTFERNRLTGNTWPTTPATNGQENLSGETYYQQLLAKGFFVKLFVNGNEVGTRNIKIVSDASKIRSNSFNNSITNSFSWILFSILSILHILLQR